MEHIERRDFTPAHERADHVVQGQHRGPLAGLDATTRNEGLTKAFATDERDQLTAADLVHLAGRTVLRHKPVTQMRDVFNAFAMKDLKHMMDSSGMLNGRGGLRKSDLVALVTGIFASSLKDMSTLLVGMTPNELEAFRRLFESGGRMDIPLGQRISPNDMPPLAPPLVSAFQQAKTLTILIPEDFHEPLANMDWEQALREAKGVDEALRAVSAVSDFYGVASYDIAYQAYKAHVANPVSEQVLYGALCAGMYRKAGNCVPMRLDEERFLVRNSLAWFEGATDNDIMIGERQLDEILDFRETYPPKPVPSELLEAGSVADWLAQLDIAQELLAFFEAHMADSDQRTYGEDESVAVDLMYRQLVVTAMQYDGVGGLLDVLADFRYDVPDEQMDYLCGLYLTFETKVPKWHNHGWTLVEQHEGAYYQVARQHEAEIPESTPKTEAEQLSLPEEGGSSISDNDYVAYERRCAELEKINETYLDEFDAWLEASGLKDKTIARHVDNVAFFLNHFLLYYDALPMEEGPTHIGEFLGGWFIRKAMWSSPATIRQTAASLKKFYKCMYEKGHVGKEDLDVVLSTIKEDLDEWVEAYHDYEDYYLQDIPF